MARRISRHTAILIIACAAIGAAPAQARTGVVTESTGVAFLDTSTNTQLGSPITSGGSNFSQMIAPDGKTAYIADSAGGVTPFNIPTRTAGSTILGFNAPAALAPTPDGSRAYVTNFGGAGTVSVFNLATNQIVGSPIPVGTSPFGIAVSPDGKRAYVAVSGGAGTVAVIDTSTNTTVGLPIPVGGSPFGVALSPDGRRLYVTRFGASSVSVIDTATNQIIGSPITVGSAPAFDAVSPDGRFLYVGNFGSGSVSVIDTSNNQVVGSSISVGGGALGPRFTPDGSFAYIGNQSANTVSGINTATRTVSNISGFTSPRDPAIVPDQGPTAAVAAPARVRTGQSVAFNGVGSSDSDGSIARFDWDFGDGAAAPNGGATQTHAYAKPGSYAAKVTATDNEGCSTTYLTSGVTPYCNAGPRGAATASIKVSYPQVKVKCPRSLGARCKVKVLALTKKKKGKAESKAAKATIKSGKSKAITLKPKGKYLSKLGNAKKVVVRATIKAGGSTTVSVKKLKLLKP